MNKLSRGKPRDKKAKQEKTEQQLNKTEAPCERTALQEP